MARRLLFFELEIMAIDDGQFASISAEGLDVAMERTVDLFGDELSWRRTQLNGMVTDVTWHKAAHRYAALYRDLVTENV